MFAIIVLLGIASTTGFSFGSRSVGVNVHGDATALKMVNIQILYHCLANRLLFDVPP